MRRAEAYDALAVHLGVMADAYASAPKLAAWLHVEKAHILERRLGRVDAARGAFDRAMGLDPSVGPVRAAYVRHLAASGDASSLCTALSDEAQIEADPARAARLELDAALLAHLQLRDDARAILLLERAAQRAPTTPAIDRRVLDELVTLHEAANEWLEAGRARRARLQFISEPSTLAFELRALAMIGERIGDVAQAISDVHRAMAVDATDPTLVELLDRLLDQANKPEQRVALWLTEAARTEEGPRRARALTKAARLTEIVLRKPGRRGQAPARGVGRVRRAIRRCSIISRGSSLRRPPRRSTPRYAASPSCTRRRPRRLNDGVRRVAYTSRRLPSCGRISWATRGSRGARLRGHPGGRPRSPGRSPRPGAARRRASATTEPSPRALLDEARLAPHDGVDVLALKTRAATALARIDPVRALKLVGEVIEAEPAHTSARTLETRLHEDAERWEAAAKSYRARIEHAGESSRTKCRSGWRWRSSRRLASARRTTPSSRSSRLVRSTPRTRCPTWRSPAYSPPPATTAR